ncbi:helicase HerA domain-containing protein [Bacillus sp. M6-12]|uniref:helicase HerA domain-containing protein n=1 Tax=Bacillus sp. M6-12 TaxID=2054166 RepID=UPI0015E12D3D|nr:DUF87 domain-containing protein [Bacillus sp. M6-12]
MDKLTVSVFENEDFSMSHIALIGKSGAGKSELLKQIVGSFLQSGKKIIWFGSYDEHSSMVEKWKGYRIDKNEDINSATFSAHSFILIDTLQIDFEHLKNILIQDNQEWILVQDDMDEVSINYEQSEFMTRKLEFLYFVSEFGRVFNLYTLVAGEDIRTFTKTLPSKKIVDNTKNLLLLEQDYTSLKHLKKHKWINEEQVKKIESLPKYEAFFIRK